jgi:hypothetical protein
MMGKNRNSVSYVIASVFERELRLLELDSSKGVPNLKEITEYLSQRVNDMENEIEGI